MNKTHSNSELIKKAEGILGNDITEQKPTVVVWGLMNAGKSHLLNMLTNHIETEYFRTNDIRETSEIKNFETEEFIFMDTPGVDANYNDDQLAMSGAEKADIILFVHQPQGELEKIEIDYLRKIKKSFGQYADKYIIMVLSKSDTESADNIELIKKRILAQCHETLGFTPRCYAISGSRFQAGVTQNQSGLIRVSHLTELIKHLESLKIDISSIKRERQLIAVKEAIKEFMQAERALQEKKMETERNIREAFKTFNRTMTEFRHWMQNNNTNLKG